MRTLLRYTLAVFVVLTLGVPGAAAQSPSLSVPAANQTLPNATGSSASLAELAGDQATVVIFWSNQCPWTAKYRERIQGLAGAYQGQGVSFVLVNSNNATAFPQESLEASRKHASGYNMPYLKDEGGQVAKAFGAQRTPHVFVFNGQGELAYTGAIDDSPGDPSAVKQSYLDNALQALMSGKSVPTAKTNAFGCALRN